jgi:putative transposase
MVHAALLLLMLEAVTTDLVSTISLKCSTQNLQLSTSWAADYPIYDTVSKARTSIGCYSGFYNTRRTLSSLDRQTPDHAYFNWLPQIAAA